MNIFVHSANARLTDIMLSKGTARTVGENTELQNFMSFLFGTPNFQGASNTTGPAIVKSYCFKLIPPHDRAWPDLGH